MESALDGAGAVDLGAQELRGRLEGFAEARVLVDRGEQVGQFRAVAAPQGVARSTGDDNRVGSAGPVHR